MIHLLKADAMAGELPDPSRKGLNPIFKARLRIDGESRRCFVKLLPDYIEISGQRLANQEAVSEAIGYVLAKSCGFSVPDAAGIIVLARQQIPARVLEIADSQSAGDDPQEHFIAWFCEDMRYPDLVGHHTIGIASEDLEERLYRRISRDLVERDELPKVVSFDEWTLNSDRHPGNLLRTGGKSLALIDHGRIFVMPFWVASRLRQGPSHCDNRLIDCAEFTDPQWSKRLPIKGKRELAYNGFTVSFRNSGERDTRQVLAALEIEAADIEHVIGFLSDRLEPAHYQRAIGLLI